MPKPTERVSPRTGLVTWRVQFRVNGRVVQESFEDYLGADEFCGLVDKIGGDAARKVLAQRRAKQDAMPTLREFTHRYLDPESGLLTGIEPGTRKGYQRVAELSFLQVLGEQPIDTIERADVGRWIAWQERQPSTRRPGETVSAKTVKNYHGLLSSVFKASIEQKLRTDNPAYKTRLTGGTRREPVFLSPEQYKTLHHFVSDYYKPLVSFLAGTGARWGEATAVTWADLNLWSTPATVRISKAWKKPASGPPVLKQPKSKKANRTISLSRGTADALPARGEGTDLVFRGRISGGMIWHHRFVRSTWMPAVEKAMDRELCAELGLTPLTRRPTVHDLRHTHASWLIAKGVPLPYVQARLGHEKITTTVDVYGHLVPEAHGIMADAIGEVLDEATHDSPALDAASLAELEAADEIEVLEAFVIDEDEDEEDDDA